LRKQINRSTNPQDRVFATLDNFIWYSNSCKLIQYHCQNQERATEDNHFGWPCMPWGEARVINRNTRPLPPWYQDCCSPLVRLDVCECVLVSRARPFFPCWWAWPEVRRGKSVWCLWAIVCYNVECNNW